MRYDEDDFVTTNEDEIEEEYDVVEDDDNNEEKKIFPFGKIILAGTIILIVVALIYEKLM